MERKACRYHTSCSEELGFNITGLKLLNTRSDGQDKAEHPLRITDKTQETESVCDAELTPGNIRTQRKRLVGLIFCRKQVLVALTVQALPHLFHFIRALASFLKLFSLHWECIQETYAINKVGNVNVSILGVAEAHLHSSA